MSPIMALGTMPTRPALLIRVSDRDGCLGWGEVWANFPPRANIHKAHIIKDVVSPRLIGMSYVEPREIPERLRDSLSVYFLHVGQRRVFEHILAGIDTALWDLALRRLGKSFAEFMELPETTAPTYASSINRNDLERLIPYHAGLGQTYFKLKISSLDQGDRDLIERASALCPTGAHIMFDSNQSWTLDQAKDAVRLLERHEPHFVEEPMPADTDLADWEELANFTSVPLAAGENIYGLENFLAMADAGVGILQPDVAKWGGVSGALELAAALPSGTMLWPHFMGTAVGQKAVLSVAAAVGNGSVCEMDVNENRLRTELCGRVMDIRDGCVDLAAESGLVCNPLERCLAEFADTGGFRAGPCTT